MQQLDLFDDEGPQPIQRWLHVWSEADRERRIKNPSTVRPYTCAGENPPERAEERVRQRTCMSLERAPNPHPDAAFRK